MHECDRSTVKGPGLLSLSKKYQNYLARLWVMSSTGHKNAEKKHKIMEVIAVRLGNKL